MDSWRLGVAAWVEAPTPPRDVTYEQIEVPSEVLAALEAQMLQLLAAILRRTEIE
jgi:hypothetical protein